MPNFLNTQENDSSQSKEEKEMEILNNKEGLSFFYKQVKGKT